MYGKADPRKKARKQEGKKGLTRVTNLNWNRNKSNEMSHHDEVEIAGFVAAAGAAAIAATVSGYFSWAEKKKKD